MLEEEAIQKIRLVLVSNGWNDVIYPAILDRGNQAIRALCKPASERSGSFKGMDDHALRAIIRECEWMGGHWHDEILAFERNRRIEELDPGTPTAANP